jgi:hypothetical protein
MLPTNILLRLMYRPMLPTNLYIHEEDRICIGIANELRKLTLDGSLKAVWFHVSNESRRTIIQTLMLKAIGLIPGTTDYCFFGATGAGLIEIKAKKGRMSDYQTDFMHWALSLGVRHAICRSVEEVRHTLIAWGLLSEPAK